MDPGVVAYIDAIPVEHRPLFDRVQRLILVAAPDATVRISYGIPTYEVGRRRLYVGAWRHGLSIYGWGEGGDGGFLARHPDLKRSKGTIQLSVEAAEAIADDELLGLARAALT